MNLFRAFSCFLSVGKVKVLEIHLLILLFFFLKVKYINYENMGGDQILSDLVLFKSSSV